MDNDEESLLVVGNPTRLVERGEHGLVILELVEFRVIEVIEDYMVAEDSLLNIFRFSIELTDVLVFKGEDSDGFAAVDLLGEVGLGEEVVELFETGVSAEEDGDVEGGGGGGDGGEQEHGGDEDYGGGGGSHFLLWIEIVQFPSKKES